ncbi:DUF1634 domain-containing protein [Acidipila rosea]|uniref:Putative membrane protein n=1 Tax=Acidipila rosea TaxID=768535 RepID=A0A4R1L1C3_9BACT|nr:DUF1634 domain-containing protein [Acidipila rosea]TCK71742.1 putative membrane protein [Acidipila rosea]
MSKMTDLKMEIAIGYMLRIGVLTAAAVVFTGGVLYLAHAHGPMPDYKVFHGVAAQLKSPKGIIEGLASGDSHSIIQFGLLLLIATPIGRVLFAAVAFAMEKDKMYTIVSLIVFAVLMYSLFHGQ